ncbi:MAG: hypothetical protein WCF84_06425 [Anaerolineae bacterium]
MRRTFADDLPKPHSDGWVVVFMIGVAVAMIVLGVRALPHENMPPATSTASYPGLRLTLESSRRNVLSNESVTIRFKIESGLWQVMLDGGHHNPRLISSCMIPVLAGM